MEQLDQETIKTLTAALQGIVHELGELKCAVYDLRQELEKGRGVSPSPSPCEPSA